MSSMMALGLFIFNRQSIPYQTSSRSVQWRHPTNSIVGGIPQTQFVGKDNDTISLSAVLMPSITGGKLSLELIEYMADSGKSHPLISGNFEFHGFFVIESMKVDKSYFFEDGSARRYEVSLQLKRTSDKQMLEYTDELVGML